MQPVRPKNVWFGVAEMVCIGCVQPSWRASIATRFSYQRANGCGLAGTLFCPCTLSCPHNWRLYPFGVISYIYTIRCYNVDTTVVGDLTLWLWGFRYKYFFPISFNMIWTFDGTRLFLRLRFVRRVIFYLFVLDVWSALGTDRWWTVRVCINSALFLVCTVDYSAEWSDFFFLVATIAFCCCMFFCFLVPYIFASIDDLLQALVCWPNYWMIDMIIEYCLQLLTAFLCVCVCWSTVAVIVGHVQALVSYPEIYADEFRLFLGLLSYCSVPS